MTNLINTYLIENNSIYYRSSILARDMQFYSRIAMRFLNSRKPFYNSVIDRLAELGSLIKAFNLQPLTFNTIT